MKILLSILLLTSAAFAGPVKKSDLEPNIDEPMIPGSRVPLERMNTAPTQPEIAPEDREFRDTLEKKSQKQEPKMKTDGKGMAP